ncbi:MAG: hypothetical protein QM778_00885 [Myxococcales bacterium]
MIQLDDLCTDADGRCLTGCEHADDSDCPKLLGEPCAGPTDCASGLCQQEHCCDAACDGVCSRCDVSGSEGTCKALDYSAADDVNNCGACGSVCSSSHVAPSCTGGQCDGACADGYADCNKDKREDGCEVSILDAKNCGQCGNACTYDFCDTQARDCVWSFRGNFDSAAKVSLVPNVLRSSSIAIGQQGVVRALGVLVSSEFAGAKVRLAIYKEDSLEEIPSELVVQTQPILVEDSSKSGMAAVAGALRVEGPVTPTVLSDTDFYWVLLEVSEPLQVLSSETTAAWGGTPDWTFADFPMVAPAVEMEVLPMLSVYAIMTPQ